MLSFSQFLLAHNFLICCFKSNNLMNNNIIMINGKRKNDGASSTSRKRKNPLKCTKSERTLVIPNQKIPGPFTPGNKISQKEIIRDLLRDSMQAVDTSDEVQDFLCFVNYYPPGHGFTDAKLKSVNKRKGMQKFDSNHLFFQTACVNYGKHEYFERKIWFVCYIQNKYDGVQIYKNWDANVVSAVCLAELV